MTLKAALHLFRPINLVFIALLQLLFYYYFINLFPLIDFLLHLVLPTLLTAMAGYIINNYFDQKKDAVNKKPNLLIFQQKYWWFLYFGINLLALMLSYENGNLMITYCVLFIQFLLFMYAYKLSNLPLVGNFIVALLSVFSLLILWISHRYNFDSFDAWVLFVPIFLISLSREIVKDIEDMRGDAEVGAQTLPIAVGKKWAVVLVNLLVICNSFFLINWAFYRYYQASGFYFALFIVIAIFGLGLLIFPLFYKKDNKWYVLSMLYKIYMLIGLLIMPVLNGN